MKKLTCLLLSLVFTFSYICLPAAAHETQSTSNLPTVSVIEDASAKDYVTEIAIQTFPEYASKIRGEHLSSAIDAQGANAEAPTIIANETRAISENEAVNYVEYSNGIVVTSLMAYAGKNLTSTVDQGTYTDYTLNAWLNVAGSSDLLMIYGVRVYIYDNGTNRMPSFGYIVNDLTTATSPLRGGSNSSGTTSSPAYVEYSAYFTIEISTGGAPIVTTYAGLLHIEAGANGPTVQGY